MSENEKEIVVNSEVPGLDGKDIDISLNERVLTIKGEKRQEKEEKEKNNQFIVRRDGSFSTSLELPTDVDANKVKATYKDGVLSLSLPKPKEHYIKKIKVNPSWL